MLRFPCLVLKFLSNLFCVRLVGEQHLYYLVNVGLFTLTFNSPSHVFVYIHASVNVLVWTSFPSFSFLILGSSSGSLHFKTYIEFLINYSLCFY